MALFCPRTTSFQPAQPGTDETKMWKDKLILNADEELKLESSKQSGFMQETDIEIYSIVRKDGTKTGSVKVTDHTAVKGFKRTISVHQSDVNGKTLVDTRFNPL